MPPDFASMIYGTAQNAAQDFGKGVPAAFAQGAELALNKEKLDQQQQQLQADQQKLATAKIEKVYDFIRDANKYTNAADRQAYLKNAIGFRNASGIDPNAMPDDQIMRLGTNENMQRLYTLDTAVAAGEMTRAEALELATNPLKADKFAAVAMTPLELMGKRPDLSESQKEFLDRQGREEVARLSADARKATLAPGPAGEKALAVKLADKYAEYTAGGGRAGMQASLAKLNNAVTALDTGKVVTGGATTVISGFKSDDAQSVINPQMVAMKTEAQGALNNVLRQTLGAQFTEKEGERIMSQIWDDRQPPKVNAARIRAKIKELDSGIKSAENEYVKRGFMTKAETSASSGGSNSADMVKFGNKQVDRAVLKAYVDDPSHAKNPDLKAAKAALGVE